MPTVKLPNGKTASFPDSMNEQQIQQAIETSPEFLPSVPKPSAPQGLTGPSQPNYSGMALKTGNVLTNLGKGAAKGALSTISSGDEWARQHLPAFFTNSNLGFGPPANLEHVRQMTVPHGTAQTIGKGAEQIGEFLIPGGAEKAGATALAEHLPQLGRFAEPASRVAMSGLSSGLVNKAQGGSFGAGAAGGMAGGALSEAGRAAAPAIRQAAHGVKGEGNATGKALLDEGIKGLKRSTVAANVGNRLNEIGSGIENAATNSPAIISMKPSRDIVENALQKANMQGEPRLISNAKNLQAQLANRGEMGPRPEDVPALEFWHAKRGVDNAISENAWNPEYRDPFNVLKKNVRGQMKEQFHEAVPEAAELDKRYSMLAPARDVKSPESHWFRLTPMGGGLIGGYEGFRHGGPEGAIKGGLEGAAIGYAGGHLLPQVGAATARGLYNPSVQRIVRPILTGSALRTLEGDQ